MKFTPYPYQLAIAEHIASHRRCNIWAGMGMGKTSAALFTIDMLKTAGIIRKPVLVLAPKRVALSTWPHEVEKWGMDLSISPIIGDETKRVIAMRKKADIYTLNYENVQWFTDHVKGHPFGTVIADESTRLKSFRTKQGGVRAAALKSTAMHATRWINLTGTPSPNGLQDLWGQQWFVDGGRSLGHTYTDFERRWFYNNPYSRKLEPHKFAFDQIVGERMAASTLSIRPEDHFDIEKPIFRDVSFELPPRARRVYDDMEQEFFAEVDGIGVEAANMGAKFTKCLQVAGGFIYTDKEGSSTRLHNEKLDVLESIVNELAGEPVIVAYHWKPDVAAIKSRFKHAKVLDDNPNTIKKWNRGEIPMLLLHPASAGHGLNLQDGGRALIFFSHWWNYENYAQVIERIGPVRQLQAGHERSVLIYHIVAEDTLDELVARNRQGKSYLDESIKKRMAQRRTK